MKLINRKNFLFSSTLGIGMLTIPDLFNQVFANSKDIEFSKRYPKEFAERESITDPILKILLFGITAPNSHNTQPWKIKIESANTFYLFTDKERQLLPIDPINRQLYHSMGTFLEFLEIGSREWGIQLKISPFPNGIDSLESTGTFPVAKIDLQPKNNLEKDPLAKFIPFRQMNRKKYEGDYLSEENYKSILELSGIRSTKLVYTLDKKKIDSLIDILVESYKKEIESYEKNEISRIWFRLSEKDIYTKRDGITLEGNGLTNPILWLAKNFFVSLSPKDWNSESALKQSLDTFKNQVFSSKGFLFLVTEGKDDPITWVNTGRDFSRICLAIPANGFVFHTMNQAFVDYPESLEFQTKIRNLLNLKPDTKIQLGGRLGKSELSFFSPRRNLKEVIL
ncbi:MAG: hypothetical protein EBS19_14015 [Spirochaetia bacterium]|nr:hypothetical protein [Spirochaetia bacterium]